MNQINEIFNRYHANKSEKAISIDEMKKDLQQYLDCIVLYGAGSAGIAFLHYLQDAGIKPVCFADGDKDKWNRECEGLKIIAPEKIIEQVGLNALIIITINTDGEHYCKDFKEALLRGGHKGLYRSLRSVGCNNLIDYTYFRRCHELFQGEKYNLPSCSDVNMMAHHQQEINETYDLMGDDISRETFIKILEFRMIDDSITIPTISDKKMYFEYNLFDHSEKEVLIDCGACGGSSLKLFLDSNQGNFKKYYGIEPDKTNYHALEKYTADLSAEIRSKITIRNAAVFNRDDKTNFYLLNGPGSFASENGPDSVETVTIDKLLSGEKATYIKMNIEGSEIPALKGAEHTLINYKPRLAIMGYHKTSDFWKVPLLIKNCEAQYKIYLRSYMQHIAFAYYAC